jgi:hypothetical protein
MIIGVGGKKFGVVLEEPLDSIVVLSTAMLLCVLFYRV